MPKENATTEVVSEPDVEETELPQLTEEEERHALRKVDMRIIPLLALCYFVLKTDSGNLSIMAVLNADKGHSLKQHLHLTAGQWSWALSAFFYSNGFFEPFSNLLFKRFTPSKWLGRILLMWGSITMFGALIKNFAGLISIRFFLGVVQAGFGNASQSSQFSLFDEQPHLYRFLKANQLCQAPIYTMFPLSSAFTGLLGYALSYIDQRANLFGWQWVFLVEGIPPILIGIFFMFFAPNYPATAKFLTAAERAHLTKRLPKNAPDYKAPPFQLQQIKSLFKQGTFWGFTFAWTLHGIAGYGVQVVLPTVVYELGFTNTKDSLLMLIPPNMIGISLILLSGHLVRKKNFNPYYTAAGIEFFIALMYLLLTVVDEPRARYVFLAFGVGAAATMWPLLWQTRVATLRGTTATAFALGWGNGWSQLAGVIGPQMYSAKYGPRYRTPFAICLCLMFLNGTCVLVTKWFARREALQWEAETEAEFSDRENIEVK